MTPTADTELAAMDRFVSSIYWADVGITLVEALPAAIDDWTATASAEHNESRPFWTGTNSDELAASLNELLAAVEHLKTAGRPGLTTSRALCEALADWGQEP